MRDGSLNEMKGHRTERRLIEQDDAP